MYQSAQPCRSSIVRSLSRVRPLPFHASGLRGLQTTSPASPANQAPNSPTQPKRASLRPIALFAIGIPLGWFLSWALKDRAETEDADGFVKYTLVRKEAVSSTCSIFTLRPTNSSAVLDDNAAVKRAITSVQFKQPQLQIARFYTLLPPTSEQESRELRFLIREERHGEVSGYLHRLPLEAQLELRGMCVEYAIPEEVEKVIFLAGGTGIAPAMQVADAVAGQADMHLLWASRLREDCVGGTSDTPKPSSARWNFRALPYFFGREIGSVADSARAPDRELGSVVAQLEALKRHASHGDSLPDRKQFKVDYFVDEEGSFITREQVSRLLQGADARSTPGGKKLLFVTGPEGFVDHWAGRKIWQNGREVQGPIGGALSQMNLAGWEVVKL